MAVYDEYTTDNLLKRIRLYDYSAASASQLSDDNILLLCDDAIRELICPELIKLNENFLLYKKDIQAVTDQTFYTMPPRCLFGMVSFIEIYETSTGKLKSRPSRVDSSNSQVRYFESSSSTYPSTYYLEDGQIILHPPGNSSYYLKIYYYRRPNRLVKKSSGAVIQNVNKTTGVVTYSSAPPSSFTSSSQHDFINGNSPFFTKNEDVQASALVGLTQTFPIASVQNLNVGDFVCISGETFAPQIPVELTGVLIDAYMMKTARSQTDQTKYSMSIADLQKRIVDIYQVPGQRVINDVVDVNIFNSPFIGW